MKHALTLLIAFALSSLAVVLAADPPAAKPAAKVQKGEMAGYLLVPHEKVPETFNAGFSLYVAAWPLVKDYPGDRFQTGLFGTWMFAQNEATGPNKEKPYSDIEGGLGWWRDTRFATETPKFIMGGVAPEFSEWANGPGVGKGRGWAIIVHPDVIEDFSCWKSLGRAVCIENMCYINSSCRDERLNRESTDAFSRLSHLFADSTVVILETPVLESEVSEEISRAAQIFRNRLVHGFLDIPMNEDEQKVLAGRD